MKALRHNVIKSKNIWAVSIVIIVSFGIYTNSLDGEFVWDDRTLFIQNYDQWQWKNIKDLLTRPDDLFGAVKTPFYRPVPNVSFLLDRSIWGRQPFGYHLSNILIHVLCTVAVFFNSRMLMNSLPGGFISSMLFADHPVHSEVVAWINGRNNAISALFYILGFYCYVRFRHLKQIKYYALSVISFGISLLCKEYAITFPIMLILYEICYRKKDQAWYEFLRRTGKWLIPYVCVLVLYMSIRHVMLPGGGGIDFQWDTIYFRLLTVPKIVLAYLKLLFFPIDLNAFHTDPLVETPYSLAFMAQSAVMALILYLWFISLKKSQPLFMGISWLLVTCLPVLNIIPLPNNNHLVSERFLYIPSVGFCMIIACFFLRLFQIQQRSSLLIKYGVIFLLILMIELHGFETLKRNRVWHNELALWQDTVKKSPESFMARTNLSLALYTMGRLEAAHQEINEAIRLNPYQDTPHYILGVILYHKASYQDSMKALERTLQINPHHKDASILLTKIKSGPSISPKFLKEKTSTPLQPPMAGRQ